MRWLYLFLCLSIPLSAQVMPNRFHSYSPLFADLEDEGIRIMPSFSGIGGFGNYTILSDDDHEWYHQLGAFAELVRFGTNASITFQSSIEMIADPKNDIRFRPAEIMWDEGVTYHHRVGSVVLQAGYFHRCKHNLDNSLTEDHRVLIYGSILLRAYWQLLFRGEPAGIFGIRADVFTVRNDIRIPASNYAFGPDMRQLLANIGFILNKRFPVHSLLAMYANIHGGYDIFSREQGFFTRFVTPNVAKFAGGAEAGLELGEAARFRLGVRYEYFHDAQTAGVPESAHLVSLGFQILSDPMLR